MGKAPYENTFLRERIAKAAALQRSGHILAAGDKDGFYALPLPYFRDTPGLVRSRYPADYECPWGTFKYDTGAYAYIFTPTGTELPSGWDAYPLTTPLQALPAKVYPERVVIQYQTQRITLDLETQGQSEHTLLNLVNEALIQDRQPFMVWKLEWAEETELDVIRISNESAMIFASGAVWSPDDQQLVAALAVSSSRELLQAIKATLANNSNKSYLTVRSTSGGAYLKGAKRGFAHASSSLSKVNAQGTAIALLHPLAGNPQEEAADHFYVVAAAGESLPDKFGERLALAVPWPTRPEWSAHLLAAGQEAELVQPLPTAGVDFSAAVRVVKDMFAWQEVISAGLKSGAISL